MNELSRAYVHTMSMVGKRATVKMCVSVSNVERNADLIIYPTVLICTRAHLKRNPGIRRLNARCANRAKVC